MDPITTPLLVIVLGNLAHELITDACKDHLRTKLASFFGWLEKLGERDKVELTYQDAMEQAYASCLEMLLLNIKGFGYSNEELKQYETSLKAFVEDDEVAEELLSAIREPGRNELPSPNVLCRRWNEIGAQQLPSDALWNAVAVAFRRQATKRIILTDNLRELLNAQNLEQLRELIERQGGVKVQVRRDKYSQRMRTKFSPVDLANLMPAYADDPGRMVIRDVFVPQNVRQNPPPVEIPKDLADRLRKARQRDTHHDGFAELDELDERELDKLHGAYVSQSPKPVHEVIATQRHRHLVLTGEPGSGKSTLMRYLLTGIIEPPVDPTSGLPLPWTLPFEHAFPLLIELRDFYALRKADECDSFLEYVAYMGKTDHWFLDDHAVNGYLDSGPSLVMFDGLDEIFDSADRERVMHEIAGFAQRYPRARILVTSRPVGYKEQVLRDAGFAHFGIQDLSDDQIDAFARGWFALTFPQQPQQAEQRIERILTSLRQSKPIRLLAGNPMLLTIMTLLAREEELPRERAKFYEKAVEVLCHHWDANRNLELPEDRYLNADDKKDLLRRIAMRMQAGHGSLKGNVIAEDDLQEEIQAYLIDEDWQPNAAEAKKAARRMIHQLRERNYILCLRGPHLYAFVHRTFLEYFCAADFVQRFHVEKTLTEQQLIELFDTYCRDDDWREVLRLICSQIDEQFVGRIVEHLATRTDMDEWDSETPLPELPLAIWCLGECRRLAKLESVGTELMHQCAALVKKTNWTDDITDQWFRNVIPASRELGERWPGKRIAYRYVPCGNLLMGSYRQPWVELIAAVDSDRAQLTELTNSGGPFTDARAIWHLAQKWPDNTTRRLLEERAVQDEEEEFVRRAALETLSETWRDDSTRELLEELALCDKDGYVRSTAIDVLSEIWRDGTTQELLTERAVLDETESVRRASLEILSKKWQDNTTQELLMKLAQTDGFAASLLGRQHSEFGKIIFAKHLDAVERYINPAKPIHRERIKRAAEWANVPPDQIDEAVRTLSEHVGWNITKGLSGAIDK